MSLTTFVSVIKIEVLADDPAPSCSGTDYRAMLNTMTVTKCKVKQPEVRGHVMS